MEIGKMEVPWCLPMPSMLASKIHLITSRPSGEVSRPRSIEENGQLCYRAGFLSCASGGFPHPALPAVTAGRFQPGSAYMFTLRRGFERALKETCVCVGHSWGVYIPRGGHSLCVTMAALITTTLISVFPCGLTGRLGFSDIARFLRCVTTPPGQIRPVIQRATLTC